MDTGPPCQIFAQTRPCYRISFRSYKICWTGQPRLATALVTTKFTKNIINFTHSEFRDIQLMKQARSQRLCIGYSGGGITGGHQIRLDCDHSSRVSRVRFIKSPKRQWLTPMRNFLGIAERGWSSTVLGEPSELEYKIYTSHAINQIPLLTSQVKFSCQICRLQVWCQACKKLLPGSIFLIGLGIN